MDEFSTIPFAPVPLVLDNIKPGVKTAIEGDSFASCFSISSETSSFVYKKELDGNVDIIDGVLSSMECESLRNEVDNCKSLTFWSSKGRVDAGARAFRDADTVEVKSLCIAEIIWERIKHYMNDRNILIPDSEEENLEMGKESRWERELPGDWIPVALNHDLLFAKYPSGGAFSPHTDGRAIHNFNRRSFQSVIIFLNDVPTSCGGGTRFFLKDALKHLELSNGHWTVDSAFITLDVPAVAGRVLVFDQALVHEGVPPIDSHLKYIIRSDIMFQRKVPICDLENDRLAYEVFRAAEDLAEANRIDEAMPLFKRAFKLSPQMAQIMGQG